MQRPPLALHLCAGFFALSGILELALPLLDRHAGSGLWDASGQALLHGLLAAGLWRRLALCRVLALVYCLAALVTYGAVLGLALAHAPLLFPRAVVVFSLLQVPSCAVLLPWLRGVEARRLFSRSLAE
jgi:hypothetical protein